MHLCLAVQEVHAFQVDRVGPCPGVQGGHVFQAVQVALFLWVARADLFLLEVQADLCPVALFLLVVLYQVVLFLLAVLCLEVLCPVALFLLVVLYQVVLYQAGLYLLAVLYQAVLFLLAVLCLAVLFLVEGLYQVVLSAVLDP